MWHWPPDPPPKGSGGPAAPRSGSGHGEGDDHEIVPRLAGDDGVAFRELGEPVGMVSARSTVVEVSADTRVDVSEVGEMGVWRGGGENEKGEGARAYRGEYDAAEVAPEVPGVDPCAHADGLPRGAEEVVEEQGEAIVDDLAPVEEEEPAAAGRVGGQGGR